MSFFSKFFVKEAEPISVEVEPLEGNRIRIITKTENHTSSVTAVTFPPEAFDSNGFQNDSVSQPSNSDQD